jgi:hypothetical protein
MTWATDHLFVAGGDYVSEYWTDFQDQSGVRAVVTVAPGPPPAYAEPAPWAALWLPLAEEGDYTLAHLSLGVQFIQAAIDAGHKVLLHGPHGVHRTRPLVAAHLVARGQSVARAIRAVEAKPWLPPYKGDAALLEAWRAWLDADEEA